MDNDENSRLFYYGIKRFIFKQECISPLDSNCNIVAKEDKSFLADAFSSFRTSVVIPKEASRDLRMKILYSDPVQIAISQDLEKLKKSTSLNKE